jgi:hypothetical protein
MRGESAPPEIVEQELYRIFGGYEGYMNAPLGVVQRQRLVLLAHWEADAEENRALDDKLREMREQQQHDNP